MTHVCFVILKPTVAVDVYDDVYYMIVKPVVAVEVYDPCMFCDSETNSSS